MRLLSLLFLLSGYSLLAQDLADPRTPAPLYAHLHEINAVWLDMASPVGLLEEVQFDTDVERIQGRI